MFVSVSVCLCLFVCLRVCLLVCMYVCLCVCLVVWLMGTFTENACTRMIILEKREGGSGGLGSKFGIDSNKEM